MWSKSVIVPDESEGEVKAGSEFAVTYLPPSRSLTTLHHPQRRLRQCRKKLLALVHRCRLLAIGAPTLRPARTVIAEQHRA